MKYLLVAIINFIYGVLLFLTLTSGTPGFTIVFVIALILTLLGMSGFILWIKMSIQNSSGSQTESETMKNWFSITKSFDMVLITGLIFRAFVLQPFIVDGASMEPNFQNNEAILVDKLTFKIRPPHRGEVVIFRAPGQPTEDYIKRIIAFPGETVKIESGQVYINGHLFDETYINDKNQTYIDNDKSEILNKTLGNNEYFVMGDNRLHSSDSREWGILPKINLVGRALISVYPISEAGIVKSPEIKL